MAIRMGVKVEIHEFLDAFVKLRKETISFVMSVCLSVLPHGAARLPLDGFSRNLIFDFFFRKLIDKIKYSLNSDKNNGHFT